MTSPYDVLGVPWGADDEAIRVAFRKAAKLYHPDLNAGDAAAAQRFKQIAAARDAILKSHEPEAGLDEDVAFDHTLLEDRHLRRKWRIIHASGVMCALVAACLVSGTVPLRPSFTVMVSLARTGGVAIDRLIAVTVLPDAELHPDRPIAYASDTVIWHVAAREPEDDFPRGWPQTQGDIPDAPGNDVVVGRVIQTSTANAATWPDGESPWWALPYGFGTATSSWPPDHEAMVPTTKAAKKPSAPRGHSATRARAAHPPVAAALSRRTGPQISAEAPRADRAAAPLRPPDMATIPARSIRPPYTLYGCWTDDGNGRWLACGGGGG